MKLILFAPLLAIAQQPDTTSVAVTTHLELSVWSDEFSPDLDVLRGPFEEAFGHVSTRIGISGEDLRGRIREAALAELTEIYGDEIPNFARTPAALDGRIVVAFSPPQGGPCGMRASASGTVEHPIVTIYTESELDPAYLYGILAHELGHILHIFTYDGARSV